MSSEEQTPKRIGAGFVAKPANLIIHSNPVYGFDAEVVSEVYFLLFQVIDIMQIEQSIKYRSSRAQDTVKLGLKLF